MTTENKRDLAADLVLCEAATPGPWTVKYNDFLYDANGELLAELMGDGANDAIFTEAREGWPHAIRRAMAAEEKWAKLRSIVVTNATGGRGEDINDYDIIRNIMDDIDAEVNDIANED